MRDYNLKVNLFGGISRKSLTSLVIFQKIMCSGDFQKLLRLSVIPHIREKYPYRHRFFMDNDPKLFGVIMGHYCVFGPNTQANLIHAT